MISSLLSLCCTSAAVSAVLLLYGGAARTLCPSKTKQPNNQRQQKKLATAAVSHIQSFFFRENNTPQNQNQCQYCLLDIGACYTHVSIYCTSQSQVTPPHGYHRRHHYRLRLRLSGTRSHLPLRGAAPGQAQAGAARDGSRRCDPGSSGDPRRLDGHDGGRTRGAQHVCRRRHGACVSLKFY